MTHLRRQALVSSAQKSSFWLSVEPYSLSKCPKTLVYAQFSAGKYAAPRKSCLSITCELRLSKRMRRPTNWSKSKAHRPWDDHLRLALKRVKTGTLWDSLPFVKELFSLRAFLSRNLKICTTKALHSSRINNQRAQIYSSIPRPRMTSKS